MKITIESTERVVEVNGVLARLWEGTSEGGVGVLCFVTRVAVRSGADQAQFERELKECRPPSAAAQSFPSKLIL